MRYAAPILLGVLVSSAGCSSLSKPDEIRIRKEPIAVADDAPDAAQDEQNQPSARKRREAAGAIKRMLDKTGARRPRKRGGKGG